MRTVHARMIAHRRSAHLRRKRDHPASAVRNAIVLAILAMVISRGVLAQPPLDRASAQARYAVPFQLSLVLPTGVRIGYEMRSYIASHAFGAFDSSVSPEASFDEIYYEALELAHGDRSNAFLGASIGSFEHEWIPLDILGIRINIPLTSEPHARFVRRWSHLPAHLYHTRELDRDKLQHFFASAWLKRTLGMDWLVELAGQAVEVGENWFVGGGFIDPRDLHANNDGRRFEMQSERNENARPASSLTPNP